MGSTRWASRSLRMGTALVVALVVGAGAGVAVGAGVPQTSGAETQLALRQDPAVDVGAGSGLDDLTTFLQSELVYLNSDALATEVQTRLGLAAAPDLSAARVDQSAVVQLIATAADARQAELAVSTAAQAYAERRTTTATATIDTQLQDLQGQSNDLRNQLTVLAAEAAPGATPGAQELALQSQLQNILQLQTALTLSRRSVERGAVVIQPATPLPEGTPAWVLGTAVGALLGLAVVAAGLWLRERLSDRLSTARDLAGVGVTVAVPALPATAGDQVPGRGDPELRRAVQLQSAHLPSLGDVPQSPVVTFFGASERVGTAGPALEHAAVLARRFPTVLVCDDKTADATAGDGKSAAAARSTVGPEALASAENLVRLVRRTPVDGLSVLGIGPAGGDVAALERAARSGAVLELARRNGVRVLVDAPPLEVSSAALEFARTSGPAVVVAEVGRSYVADVVSAVSALRSAAVVVDGVILTTAPRTRRELRPPGAAVPARATDEITDERVRR